MKSRGVARDSVAAAPNRFQSALLSPERRPQIPFQHLPKRIAGKIVAELDADEALVFRQALVGPVADVVGLGVIARAV